MTEKIKTPWTRFIFWTRVCCFFQYSHELETKWSICVHRQLICSPKNCYCLLHVVVSCLKISQSVWPLISPSLPFLKNLCPLTACQVYLYPRDMPMSSIKEDSRRLRRDAGCQLGHRISLEGGVGSSLRLVCVTLAGCLPSPLSKACSPSSTFSGWVCDPMSKWHSLAGSQNTKWSHYSHPTFVTL